jgi:hypothetical protein
VNGQSASAFADEHALIVRLNPKIEWRRPSLADADRELLDRATFDVGPPRKTPKLYRLSSVPAHCGA